MPCAAQGENHQHEAATASATSLKVNWVYGAYIPKDAPLTPLSGKQPLKLYLRQSFTSLGIYLKTAIFSVGDQIDKRPPEWGKELRRLCRSRGFALWPIRRSE
jgi:hypothetical protein